MNKQPYICPVSETVAITIDETILKGSTDEVFAKGMNLEQDNSENTEEFLHIRSLWDD